MTRFLPFGRRENRSLSNGTGPSGAGSRSVSVYVYVTLALVVISLLSLFSVPLLLYEKSACPVATLAEPTGAIISDIERLAPLEAFVTSRFLLTGDTGAKQTVRWIRDQRAVALQTLAEIPEFGPEFTAEARRLASGFASLDQQLDALYDGRIAADQYVAASNEQGPHAFMTQSLTRLREDIAAHIGVHRQETRGAERRASVLSLLSTGLAIVAVLAVAQLGQRYRRAAEREQGARARSEDARADAERQRQEIERISASRAVLVRGFSHDLGHPLVAADWHLRLIEESDTRLPRAEAEAVSSARQSVRTAIQMIADLLDLANAQAGQIRIHVVPMDIAAVASRVVQEFKAAADGKGLQILKTIDTDVPVIQSDPERVRQILSNLVANAIKYTTAGEVAVRVDGRGTPDRVVVEVSDTGPGLDEEQQRRVFDEFYRANAAGTPPGAGIGLAISHRLALALGGELRVTSTPGSGSTFVLELPRHHGATTA